MNSLISRIAGACVLAIASNASVAGVVTQTGADLLSNPDVSFPTLPATVSGSSITFGTGDINPVLVRWDLFGPGTLTGASPTTSVTVSANLTRNSADWDMTFGLWDGTNYAAVFPAFDGATFLDALGSTSDGVHNVEAFGTSIAHSTTMNIGDAAEFIIEFVLADGLTTLNFSGLGLTTSVSTASFDRTQGLSLLFSKQSSGEQAQINSVTIESDLLAGGGAVPAPLSIALMGVGLAGIGFASKRKRA